MGSIVYDSQTGTLVEGIVWEFTPVPDRNAADDRDETWAELRDSVYETLYECAADPTHETGLGAREVKVDLLGGPVLGDFLPVLWGGDVVVSRFFADRLRSSGLTGLSLRSCVRVDVNQSRAAIPELELLDVVGRGGFCRRWRIEDAPNLCPYCKSAPILCSGCGWSFATFHGCPACGKRTHHGGGYLEEPDGQSLRFDGDRNVAIVEGGDWDGSDFLKVNGVGGGWFVTQRAKAWLERTGTRDIEFKVALTNVDGLELSQPSG